VAGAEASASRRMSLRAVAVRLTVGALDRHGRNLGEDALVGGEREQFVGRAYGGPPRCAAGAMVERDDQAGNFARD